MKGGGWAGHVSHMKEKRNACRDFVVKLECKIPGRPRRIWEDTIKMDVRKIRWG
jgi:hypothetical protein